MSNINNSNDVLDKIYKNIKGLRKNEKILIIICIFILILILSLFNDNEALFNHNEAISLLLLFITPFIILFIIVEFSIFYYKKKLNKYFVDRENNLPKIVSDIESKILKFESLTDYNNELWYHTDLARFLKQYYPNLTVELEVNYKRPDIVIDNIAIEVKWPTRMSDLKTIPDKINSYLKEWDFLIIVLFNIDIVGYNEEKNIEAYKNKKNEILDNILDEKKEKILFIEI